MASKITWGILGTGVIANKLAKAIAASRTGEVVAVGSRAATKAEAFARQYGIARHYGSYQAVLDDKGVQAIYISLPNHLHAEWTVKAARAGKHILCEKPLATNAPEATVMIEAARRAGVVFLEAFMYRCHPQTAKLVELVRDKAIGDVRFIQAAMSFNMGLTNFDDIRLRNDAAGGGVMDVGCYGVSMARLLAGAAMGKPFAEPTSIKAVGHVGEKSRVDEYSAATLVFPGDIYAQILCGTQVRVEPTLRIWGSAGNIIVPQPWGGPHDGGDCRILVTRQGPRGTDAKTEEVIVRADLPTACYEVDEVGDLIGKATSSAKMTWPDSVGNMKALDKWRDEIGLKFDSEKEFGPATCVPGHHLSALPKTAMTYGKIDGLDKPVSKLVIGTMGHVTGWVPGTAAILDAFVEMGGTCIDTARVYGTEPMIGKWLASRGIREQMVILGKGSHPPECSADWLDKHIVDSLDRFKLDYFDIFMIHRDDPAVPIGEFVDVFNRHKKAGRVRTFGGSNFSLKRLDEAAAYAAKNGLTPFVANSPNFSLAVWNEPMWQGNVTAVDAASRAWHKKTQMPMFAWSSQAMGFWSGKFGPQDRGNPGLRDLVRVWFNDANFKRLDRARELAKKHEATVLQIALAWVLCQEWPVFALVGPGSIDELRESVGALRLNLTAQELAWLNLEA